MEHRKLQILFLRLFFLFPLSGCAAVGMTLVGVGAGVATGLQSLTTLEGIAYRTFTAPISEVEGVTRTALHRMRIKIQATSKTEQGKTIKAVSNDREIEIELEMAGAKTTRIRTVAKQGIFFKDCASATEIIMQTERVLGV
jgi:hypothetical protein